jgi:hypothetical protein
MKPFQFVKQFEEACKRHKLNPVDVWFYCDMDEHQTLIDEQPGEWEDLEQCLKIWAKREMVWEKRHDIPLLKTTCNNCKWFDSNACGWFQKAIPDTFNKLKGCKHWNDEK